MESVKNIALSFILEFVGTGVLLLVIYMNAVNATYRSALTLGGPYTGGPIVTGLTLMGLVFLATWIAVTSGVSAGHMFPLITIPAMIGKLGILNVSLPKGIVLLIAQFSAMGLVMNVV